jgi:hypothetical protein
MMFGNAFFLSFGTKFMISLALPRITPALIADPPGSLREKKEEEKMHNSSPSGNWQTPRPQQPQLREL